MEPIKKKKRVWIWVIALILLASAGAVAYAYATTAVRVGESPAVSFSGHTAAPASRAYTEPVLGGLLQKRAVQESS